MLSDSRRADRRDDIVRGCLRVLGATDIPTSGDKLYTLLESTIMNQTSALQSLRMSTLHAEKSLSLTDHLHHSRLAATNALRNSSRRARTLASARASVSQLHRSAAQQVVDRVAMTFGPVFVFFVVLLVLLIYANITISSPVLIQ